ncbi:argininosuccinate synthase, partial [Tanacetum coccineum]
MAHMQQVITSSSTKPLVPGPIRGDCLKLGAKASDFCGVAFVHHHHHHHRTLSQVCKSKAIEAVMASDKGTDALSVTNRKGLRGKLNKVVLAYSGGLDTS